MYYMCAFYVIYAIHTHTNSKFQHLIVNEIKENHDINKAFVMRDVYKWGVDNIERTFLYIICGMWVEK